MQHSNVAQATRKLAEGVQTLIRNIVDGPSPVPAGKHRDGGVKGTVWMLGCSYDYGPESVCHVFLRYFSPRHLLLRYVRFGPCVDVVHQATALIDSGASFACVPRF